MLAKCNWWSILKPADHEKCRTFVYWVLEMQTIFSKIIFNDKSHLIGFINRLNCLIWSFEHPRTMVVKPLYLNKLLFGAIFRSALSLDINFSRTIKVTRLQSMRILWHILDNTDIYFFLGLRERKSTLLPRK